MTPRPYLTTAECAHVLGVSCEYIRGEIDEGRLEAEVILRPVLPGRRYSRRIIRIYGEQFSAYLSQYWPRVRWPAA